MAEKAPRLYYDDWRYLEVQERVYHVESVLFASFG
jgi:hypothetical protein